MLLLAGMALGLMSFVAVATTTIKEGVDYTVLAKPVVPTPESAGKVNVKEFFSLVCIHCKDLEPLWEKAAFANNKNVDIQKIHVVWDGADQSINNFAKLNATMQALKLNRLYIPAFTAIFARQDLTNLGELRTFLAKNGLNKSQQDNFINTYNSFSISAKVGEYKDLTDQYGITGTPTIVIADKYVVSPAQPPRLIEVTDALIKQQLEAGKTPKKPAQKPLKKPTTKHAEANK